MKAKALKLADEVLAKEYAPRLEIAKELRRLHLENEQLKSREWVGLTDEEIGVPTEPIQPNEAIMFARVIEALIKGKNT